MAEKNDSGDKTELPTPKKLRDARKKGDVAKSKDISAGLLTLAWFLLIVFGAGYIGTQIQLFFEDMLDLPDMRDAGAIIRSIGWKAAMLLLKIAAVTLIPVAILATIAEYLQVGPVMTGEKMKPTLDKLNPVEGLKRMFGMDGLVELVKTLVKVLLVCAIVYIMIKMAFNEVTQFVALSETSPLGRQSPQIAAEALAINYKLAIIFLALIVVVFMLVGFADRIYSKHRFIKKMKMSMRDIRKEQKDDEGDPHIKSHRRELHQQWANQNAIGAVGDSSALLVNPTHLAIALDYDEDDCPVPVIAAKGQGNVAAAMRAEAERCDVPIIRNVATARRLWARGEIGEIIPEDMFDAIAQIILWAKKAREGDAPMWNDLDNKNNVATRSATEHAVADAEG